ncbi:DoxX family protein [Rubeoparvulum massiliense]|uniref:DoxX family protein n=1 Tax=Rubeoparvulum massiliense TaxID=1631346 RepID=UPI00065E626C|nr:DoxX family protein [Rubeoparvulum massiliense]
MMNWLRTNKISAGILLVLRVWLGWHWMTAGWGKLTNGFDASGFMKGAIAKAGGDHPAVQSWWASFLDGFALPNVGFFNFLMPWGEFLVGLGLILGTLTTAAAFFGLVMNFAFFFSGTVSSNPQMIIVGFIILMAGFNAGRYGGDYWVIPYLRQWWNRRVKKDATVKTA